MFYYEIQVDRVQINKTYCLICVQALKSLTLIRLGKNQEAETLLEEVRVCKPSDESTLLALTACYRELKKRNFNKLLYYFIISNLLGIHL